MTESLQEDPIAMVMQRCCQKEDLTSDDIKEMFEVFAIAIESIKNQNSTVK